MVDEAGVEVMALGGAVLGHGGACLHHPSSLAQPPQQLLKVRHLCLDEHPSPGGEKLGVMLETS